MFPEVTLELPLKWWVHCKLLMAGLDSFIPMSTGQLGNIRWIREKGEGEARDKSRVC